MKELSKKEIIDVMRCAGCFQREVFQVFGLDADVIKYKEFLYISVSYTIDVVSYDSLFKMFRLNFYNYKKYINCDECYSFSIPGKEIARFEVSFYA